MYEKAINRSNLGDLCTITSPTRDIRPCAPCERALKHSVFLFLFLLCFFTAPTRKREFASHISRDHAATSRGQGGGRGTSSFSARSYSLLIALLRISERDPGREMPQFVTVARARAKRDFNATQTAPLSFRFFFLFFFPSPRHSRTVSTFGATRTPTSRGLLIFRIRLRSRRQRRDACFAIVTGNSLCVGWLISFACPPLLYLH